MTTIEELLNDDEKQYAISFFKKLINSENGISFWNKKSFKFRFYIKTYLKYII